MEGLLTNIPNLEDPRVIFILTKSTEFIMGHTIDVSKFDPGCMLQMYFELFYVETTREFTPTFVAIFYAT